MMELSGRSFIGFARAEQTDITGFAHNPRTGESIGPGYQAASMAELERACALAAAAADAFAGLNGARRAEFLNRIASNLAESEADFLHYTVLETGLPEARVKGELARTCGQLRMFAELVAEGSWVDARIDHADPQRLPPKPELRSQREALGPVAVFCASNFPLAFSVAGGDTASAFAAGCPVVVKAHSQHPISAEIAARAIVAAAVACALPEGVFSLLFGPGETLGVALVQHGAILAVGFTGSQTGGRALMDAAARRAQPIPVFAEMGSLNPVFIFPGALARQAEHIATALHQSITNGNGQFCTCPGIVLAMRCKELAQFKNALVELLAKTARAPMLSLSGAQRYRASVSHVSEQAGVEILVQGVSAIAMCEPSLLAVEVAQLCQNHQIREEMFGPAALYSEAENLQDMLRLATALDGQLTATVWAEADDLPQVRELLPLLRKKAGRVLFNGVPTGVEVNAAQVHGGPFPASSDARFSAVGTGAIHRFSRPVCYQNCPAELLPASLQETNPLGLWRTVDGRRQAPERG